MDEISVRCQVFFEDPFWIGIFEKNQDGGFSVSKVTFGAEPKDYEVYSFILKNFYNLSFSPSIEGDLKDITPVNPKRLQRKLKKQLENVGVGTKSQQALRLQQEEGKKQRKAVSRKQREADEKRLYEMKQKKKKEKHRGR